MANLNDRENNPNNVPNPDIPPVVEPTPVEYQEGYTQGRAVEQNRYEANQQIRDNDNAGRGLLIGLILAGTAAIVGGGLYLLNQSNQTPVPVNSTIVVPSAAPSPSVSPSPQVRERIIERDRVVPVPQAPAQAPRVNITIPQPQQSAPAQQAAPAQSSPQPTSPANSVQPNSSTNSPANSGSSPSPGSTTNPTGTGSGQ
ncbi:hypothetical protein C7B65_06240 [Phormidesmis priestleyi ULC007]|uniref:Uncharacterized protein n=1 Tax=Phormidesmis priestleyi ULC007 TaxID=1920490 RepID=A0A2T1DKL8_9CYAN|nr:hypothetical protein [Phormidesmis priestleyi]PSB20995.1 hypothetical protein C7B65_06240 [Phormidesmis priestleyi ULC007]PZO53669.1 MAG: hypothetical protein DCF14_04610 [Phormidesmis priestleyi]